MKRFCCNDFHKLVQEEKQAPFKVPQRDFPDQFLYTILKYTLHTP